MAVEQHIEDPRVQNAIEKYSSSFTLSDMEIFVFPELMSALVLANIMSPIIWEWKKIHGLKELKRNHICRE